jgi:hypothetical protein
MRRWLDLGKRRRLEVRSSVSDLPDFVGVPARNVSKRAVERSHSEFKMFSEKSFERWSEYACGVCKHLVYRRDLKTRVCDIGHSVTKDFCADFIDDHLHIRIRMPNGEFMYLGQS